MVIHNLFAGLSSLLFALEMMGIAHAFCIEPTMYSDAPSSPGTFQRPSVPHCLSGYRFTGRHNCSSWEVEAYIAEVNDYIRKLNEFAEEAGAFAKEAIEFANDAIRYANCEAEDVKSEIQ